MSNALSVQAQAVSHPPPQTQDRIAAKAENQKPPATPPPPTGSGQKVDIHV